MNAIARTRNHIRTKDAKSFSCRGREISTSCVNSSSSSGVASFPSALVSAMLLLDIFRFSGARLESGLDSSSVEVWLSFLSKRIFSAEVGKFYVILYKRRKFHIKLFFVQLSRPG